MENRIIKFKAFVRGYMVDVVTIDFVNKYITWDDNQYDRRDPPNKCFEIESFEEIKLMQFTGFKDKHGKEIYENDIISAGKTLQGKNICWEVKFYWSGWRIGDRRHAPTPTSKSFWKYIEIIGNIYANPELLTPNK